MNGKWCLIPRTKKEQEPRKKSGEKIERKWVSDTKTKKKRKNANKLNGKWCLTPRNQDQERMTPRIVK
jgi:hypothetical protein